MQPHLQTAIARQRRDYGIDEETFSMEHFVIEQACNLVTPVQNIWMETQCGKVDYRLKKLGRLNAVSRSAFYKRARSVGIDSFHLS
ncbi:hypothetical protein DPMN_114194 [Dreissena polymorpha]|uniref:Uncharacterized protein n=1 Tax=Dreissena polymorpha TaxID=45954 RepID=A0A9D4KJK7_DREPO|nr:hypothetical protein DPMN_114194 [Dreissena polymorpha]